MSDSDFAVLIRHNRERLGLTASRVAELIGRSPGTVRAWEKGTTRPTDDSVVSSLAAVLGIDEGALFEAAGLEPPVMESSPSMRQALSTLAPRWEPTEQPSGQRTVVEVEADRARVYEAPTAQSREPSTSSPTLNPDEEEETDVSEPATTAVGHVRSRSARPGFADRLRSATLRRTPRPASAPSTLPPVPMTPSYMEDANERWSYRLRAVYTAVGVVLLVIVLGWAATNFFDSLGQLWSELTANL